MVNEYTILALVILGIILGFYRMRAKSTVLRKILTLLWLGAISAETWLRKKFTYKTGKPPLV